MELRYENLKDKPMQPPQSAKDLHLLTDAPEKELHTLRHTFASQLAMAGVSLKEIQELMGHLSFETTLQYAHLSEDHVKKQVLKLPFAEGWDGARHN